MLSGSPWRRASYTQCVSPAALSRYTDEEEMMNMILCTMIPHHDETDTTERGGSLNTGRGYAREMHGMRVQVVRCSPQVFKVVVSSVQTGCSTLERSRERAGEGGRVGRGQEAGEGRRRRHAQSPGGRERGGRGKE